ncbi:MAG: hypothetical protein ACUVRM_05395 [Bacillota bacterium]
MRPLLGRGREGLLFAWTRALLVLGFLGPLLGRAGFRQTLVLAFLLGFGSYLAGVFLEAARPGAPACRR